MASETQPSKLRTASRLLSVLAILTAAMAAAHFLLPNPLSDVFFAGWVLVSVLLPIIGAIGAWTNRTPIVWVAAILMTGLSIIGMWSIGFLIAPAALFLLGSALTSQVAGPRTDVREAIVADPPTVPEAVMKTLAGTASLTLGAALVHTGAIARELFRACARETLDCAINNTYWDRVGITVFGLLAIGFGGWLIWKQAYIARVLASAEPG